MNIFCHDRDLLAWEPAAFSEAAVAHLALLTDAAATVTGTTVALDSASFAAANVAPGMIMILKHTDGTPAAAVEIASVNSPAQATVSVLRAALTDNPTPPAISGSAKATVVSFRPLIAAVGDELLTLLGASDETLASADGLGGLKAATVFGTLAAVYRAAGPTREADSKLALYTRLYQLARRAIAGHVTIDGVNHHIWAAVAKLERA